MVWGFLVLKNWVQLVFVKIYIANEIKIRQFILFNIRRMVYMLISNMSYMNVEIMFF